MVVGKQLQEWRCRRLTDLGIARDDLYQKQ